MNKTTTCKNNTVPTYFIQLFWENILSRCSHTHDKHLV